MIIPGVYLLQRATLNPLGLIYGLLAALLAATFSTLNKKVIPLHEPRMMTFVQLGSGAIFLTGVICIMLLAGQPLDLVPAPADYLWLGLISLVCTTLPYVLALRALKHIDAFASALTINLETLYGIILGIIFFPASEKKEPLFYIGAGIILAAVFLHPFITQWQRKRREALPPML